MTARVIEQLCVYDNPFSSMGNRSQRNIHRLHSETQKKREAHGHTVQAMHRLTRCGSAPTTSLALLAADGRRFSTGGSSCEQSFASSATSPKMDWISLGARSRACSTREFEAHVMASRRALHAEVSSDSSAALSGG
eukprot:s3253_g12.t1